MTENYKQICQRFKEMRSKFSIHTEEARRFLNQFILSFVEYLGCNEEDCILIKQDGQQVRISDINDAIYLDNTLLPWTLLFAIRIKGKLLPDEFPKLLNPEVINCNFLIKLHARRTEESWLLKIVGEDREFFVPANTQGSNGDGCNSIFHEINKFIYLRTLEDIESYFDKFITFGMEPDKEARIFGFESPLENTEENTEF
ncbi:hypothetical protein QHH11_05090 [Aphanizomenon sp. PH219]|nr:hypothetical protein [Aphanizomenon sp. 202]MDK2458516.1 hypothetical protein [Aphanizomenon sp. PH219]